MILSYTKMRYLLSIVSAFLFIFSVSGQVVLERVIGVVGSHVILQSEMEQQISQMKAQGSKMGPDTRCEVYESLLMQGLLLNQAKVDSVEVSESTVDQQLDSRLKYFISMIGSKEKLEEYFNKSLPEIKQDLRTSVRDQLVTQKMQGKISGDVKITPTEISHYYKTLPKDSIPFVNSQVEVRQIVLYPSYNDEAIFLVKETLLELRKRINDGEKFSTLAKLYSEDPMSARNGGEIGFFAKGELDPEYAKAAFTLKENQISKIVESQFGFHIIQMIERKDEKINTRHILLKPKASQNTIADAQRKLDSIVDVIRKDSITFEKAAALYSKDKGTNKNEGLLINQRNSSSRFEMDQLPTADYYVVKDMKVGEVSEPYITTDENMKQVVKIILVKSRTLPHVANLDEDYELLENLAVEDKKISILDQWVKKKIKTTFLQIGDEFAKCSFKTSEWNKK